MRRITMWVVATVCGLVLLFSYRTSLSGPGTSAAGGGTGPGAAPPGIVSATTAPSAAPSTASSAAAPQPAARDVTVNGSVARTRWGPVQVQVRIAGGRIVEVTALEVPNGNSRDDEINGYAVPQLRQEVLDAQSADIDAVSGATVTSDGYRESLQAALDSAHFTG
jgi:uncharacterized protein with FMN-binding domain